MRQPDEKAAGELTGMPSPGALGDATDQRLSCSETAGSRICSDGVRCLFRKLAGREK